jgi:hypothetical protein
VARYLKTFAAPICVGAAFLGLVSTASAAQQVIVNESSPLTSIYLNDDLSCSIDRASEAQVYGGTDPGSCGTWLNDGATTYGPGVGPSVGALYTPVSQDTSVPNTVKTTVDVGPGPDFQIEQTDSYDPGPPGQDFYSTSIKVTNNTASPAAVKLYHGMDCFLRGDDEGYGSQSPGEIYCSRQPNVANSGLLGFSDITPGFHYLESGFEDVWSAINGANLANTCGCTTLQDNGVAINWDLNLAASGGTQTVSFNTQVTPDTTHPTTAITGGPTGTTGTSTPTFSFDSNEPGVTFECGVDDPSPTLTCFSPFTTSPLANGQHIFYVRATDHDGNVDATPASRSFTVHVSPAGGGTVGGSGGTPKVLAPPVAGKSFDASPASGKVYFKCRGRKRTRLRGAVNLPVGCLVDARKGKVNIVSAANKGSTKTKSAVFYDGQFKVKEKRATRLVTELALAGKLEGCTRKGGKTGLARDARRHKRRGRRLWGRGHGRFRTRGRHSSASVRGTTWFVEDRCDGSTLTKVRKGRVSVRDFVKHKTVTLKAGHTYIAKPKKKRKHRRR